MKQFQPSSLKLLPARLRAKAVRAIMSSRLGRAVTSSCRRFGGATSGAAAIEFAIIVPVLAGALMLMIDFALAVQTKFNVERKQRMAIEGVLRFGDDKDAVMNFANVDGRAAFNLEAKQVDASTPILAIKRFYTCRGLLGATTSGPTNPGCLKPEIWFELKTTATYTGSLSKKYNLQSKTSVLVKP